MLSTIKAMYDKLRYRLSAIKRKEYNRVLSLDEIKNSYPARTFLYRYFHHFFCNLSPAWLVEHRLYFKQNKRGFGEDAFHAMWYFIFKEFQPKNILEVGVYRGQTLSLFSLLAKNLKIEINIHGISPFTSAGDNVSIYSDEPDYYQDVILNFKHFHLPLPVLHKGFSTDNAMQEVFNSKQWDLIYIDGNHDYEVAKYDFAISAKKIKKGGLIVMDDASLYTDFKPPFYATAGHPGPSKVANEIDPGLFEEILSVGHNRVFKKL